MPTSERSFTRQPLLLLATILSLLAATGCAATNTQTAHQLQPGELVLAGTIDMPGYLFVPRLSAHASYGYGPGDISARAGSALLTNFIGVGTRAYPAEWLNISLDADLLALMVPFSGGTDDWMTMLVFTPRISSSADEGRLFYGGLQSNIVFADPLSLLNIDPRRLALLGLFGGVDWRSAKGFGVQAEITLSPVAFFFDDRTFSIPILDPEERAPGAFEFTLGFYWSRPPQALRPTPEPH